MNRSRRHHYIPKFLISNFTDSDGLFYVWNKTTNRLINTRQSPKSIFFEMDRNTVNFSGQPMDNLEALYAQLDSHIAVDINNVLQTENVTPEQLTSIITLATLLKWRTPVSDDAFNVLKGNTGDNDLSIEISIKDKNLEADESALAHIHNSEIFKETKRILLSIKPLLNDGKLLEIADNYFIHHNERFSSIIGDCPVIEKLNSDFNEIEDFIFPLSSTDTFIFKKNSKKSIKNLMFFLQMDLAVFHASKKYVGCKDKEHLEKLVKLYDQLQEANVAELIPKILFDFID